MPLIERQMSLFDAPEGSLLIHAVNCRGVQGSGIAAEFKRRFSFAFDGYHDFCMRLGDAALGRVLIVPDGGYLIGTLFTSRNYGKLVDSPETILESTGKALAELESCLSPFVKSEDFKIYSNKFNSGLFRVDWSETAAILNARNFPVDWIVCDHCPVRL